MAPGAMAAGVDSLNVVAAAAIACCLLAGPAGPRGRRSRPQLAEGRGAAWTDE
jgi:hypothetical protein